MMMTQQSAQRRWKVASKAALASVLVLAIAAGFARALACPFCSATAQTFTEEMATMDVVVIARLVQVPPPSDDNEELAKARFEVVQILKGEKSAKIGDKIETIYFGDGKPGSMFLVTGIDPPKTMWSTPLILTARAQEYLPKLLSLPKDGNERYTFFQKYLEDADEMLARDAYDEFAKAPYSAVKDLKPHMNHDQLVSWIQNPDIPASRRRLYFVMLGICGGEQDLDLLETSMKSSDRKIRAGLDSMIACYLTLKGEKGMDLVEELFLKNKKADYADTYSAIMALRFHGTEGGVIKRERLLVGLKYMLKRPELADLVIPDLASWEDWSAVDELFELFKHADDKSTWVRVPVINYLRKCPLARAKELLKECEKIDPASVKRANTFFPGDPAPTAPDPKKAARVMIRDRSATVSVPTPTEDVVAKAEGANGDVAAANLGAAPAAALRQNPVVHANRWLLLAVPWGIGLAMFVVQYCVLRGLGS